MMKMKQMYNHLKDIAPVALVSVLVLLGAVTVVNAQGEDSDVKPSLDDKDALLYDAQGYASNNNVSTEEALRRFQLQDIAGKLNAELSMNETGTFAGLWVEHNPKFKVVVQFTRNGEETIKSYMKQYADLASIVEVRNVKESYADLKKAQLEASSSVSASGIPVDSSINISGNTVEMYVVEADRSRFDDALQKREIRLPDSVRVITVEGLALAGEDIDASSSPTAQASLEASGFGVILAVIGLLVVTMRKRKT